MMTATPCLHSRGATWTATLTSVSPTSLPQLTQSQGLVTNKGEELAGCQSNSDNCRHHPLGGSGKPPKIPRIQMRMLILCAVGGPGNLCHRRSPGGGRGEEVSASSELNSCFPSPGQGQHYPKSGTGHRRRQAVKVLIWVEDTLEATICSGKIGEEESFLPARENSAWICCAVATWVMDQAKERLPSSGARRDRLTMDTPKECTGRASP